MKKYIFFIVLIFIISVSFCGCGAFSREEERGVGAGGEALIESGANGSSEYDLPSETDFDGESTAVTEGTQSEEDNGAAIGGGVSGEDNEGENSNDNSVEGIEVGEKTLPEEGREEGVNNEEKAVYARAKVDGLNVRTGAGTAYKSLGYLDKGDMVVYLGEENGWYATYYMGQNAYISANYAELYESEKGSNDVESVITEGCKLLGTKYVYGAVRLHDGYGRMCKGFTAEEFDCSSLMQYIFYYGADECLQVNTRTQVYQGDEVKKEDIQRGDLLFFTNASRYNKTGIERIGHVALYLGDGYILHTASDHAVIEKISSVRDRYFICARRIIE